MRRNIAILALVAAAAAFVSCREDNGFVLNVPKTIDVTSGADIAFKAIGGSGAIEVAPTEGQLEAVTAQSDWCHLSVSGNRIEVSVDGYDGLESRYAIVEMKAGNATGQTIVQQFGVIVKEYAWKDITVKNPAQDITFPYDADETPVVPTCDADWITFTVTPDKLVAHVSENVDKDYREALVHWALGSVEGEFVIGQFDLADAGLLGAWTWHGYHNGKTDYPMATILSENADGTYRMKMDYSSRSSSSAIDINLQIDGLRLEKNRLMLPLGVYAGTYTLQNLRTGVTTVYYAYPLFASGTSRLMFDEAVTENALPLVISKNAETGAWQAVADTDGYPYMTFRFEMWDNRDHENVSRSGLILSNVSMEKN